MLDQCGCTVWRFALDSASLIVYWPYDMVHLDRKAYDRL